jgi:hypothetical protein
LASTEYRTADEMLRVTKERADEIIRRRSRRRRVCGSLFVVVVLGAGVLTAVEVSTDESGVMTAPIGAEATSTTVTRGVLAGPESWEPMASSPLSPRSASVAVWTGQEMLVWRGDGAFSDACEIRRGGVLRCGEAARNDGAAYDPANDTWRVLPSAPLPDEEGSDLAYEGIWTGREFVVWGGVEGKGAAYDPERDRWRLISSAPLEPRTDFSLTWTGKEIIVHGGGNPDRGERESPTPLDDGAAYDPATDRWRSIARSGTSRAQHSALWLNGRLLVVGGVHYGTGAVTALQSYDPDTNAWTKLADSPLDDITGAVWSGSAVLAFGSVVRGEDEGRRPAAASYDPVRDAWTMLPTPPIDNPVVPSVAWSGRELLVLGSPFVGERQTGSNQGVAFDPVAGSWRALPDSGLPHWGGTAVVWAGDQLLAWGGAAYTGYTSEPFDDGARYRPGAGR